MTSDNPVLKAGQPFIYVLGSVNNVDLLKVTHQMCMKVLPQYTMEGDESLYVHWTGLEINHVSAFAMFKNSNLVPRLHLSGWS